MANELTDKIASQIKYYFSDFNLLRDKFMKEELKKDDGWISIDTLLTFKRLAALTTDPAVVGSVVKTHAADLMEVDESLTKIRRSASHPLPATEEGYLEEVLKKTLHIKGFPLESTFDQLWSFFTSLGQLESLLLRKRRKGSFKGCVLAVFKDPEDAEKVLKGDLTYNENPLMKEKEEAHLARKREYFENRKNSKKGKNGNNSRFNRGKKRFHPKSEQENVKNEDEQGTDDPDTKKVKLEAVEDPIVVKTEAE